MDRRAFLALLGAVGVLTGAPSWLRDPRTSAALAPGIALPEDDDVSAWLAPTDLAVHGRQRTFEFWATNDAPYKPGRAWDYGDLLLKRLPEDGGATLMSFRLAPGGILRWAAAPGQEILGPVRFVAPEFVRLHVTGTDALGRIVMASKDGIVPLYPQ